MNIASIYLVLHLIGAVCTGLLIIASFLSLNKQNETSYRSLAISLALTSCFQLVSGSLLAASNQNSESILGYCSKIGLYLFLVLFVEVLLFSKMTAKRIFPIKVVTSSITMGIAYFLVTISPL